MKTHKFILLFILFSITIIAHCRIDENDASRFKPIDMTGRVVGFGGKSISPININSLEAYLINGTELSLQTIDVDSEFIFSISIIDKSTNNIIYGGSIETNNGNILVPLNIYEGEYSLIVTYDNIIWEGNFQIEDENL